MSALDFRCGWCEKEVAANLGWAAANPRYNPGMGVDASYPLLFIALCPRCGNPTYLKAGEQIPGAPFGESVEHLPSDVANLYREARSSTGAGNLTAAILVGRKLLMHVAVQKGAAPNQSFAAYIKHLVDEHVITRDMGPWVDEIRQLGNEANHEITPVILGQAQARVRQFGRRLGTQ